MIFVERVQAGEASVRDGAGTGEGFNERGFPERRHLCFEVLTLTSRSLRSERPGVTRCRIAAGGHVPRFRLRGGGGGGTFRKRCPSARFGSVNPL